MNFKQLNWRKCSQIYFLLLYLIAGYFLCKALNLLPVLGQNAFAYRFPCLEGFLPISATVGLKYWLFTGNFDPIHPAGLTILLLAISSAFLLKRGFCSHICPIGTISEYAYKARTYFLKFTIKLPKLLTYFLRVPKYLLLGFLLLAVFVWMPFQDIVFFIRSPYNTISEVKMLYFFLEPSLLTLEVITGLLLFSLLISNFWCRFLCPYGALLSIFSFFSLIAVTRNREECVSCHSCEKACPSQLSITNKEKVSSVECTFCQNCIKTCPRGALKIQSDWGGYHLTTWQYSCVLLGIFIVGLGIAAITGHWASAELPAYWLKYAPMAHMIFH
ncbi:MAG: 4Fe-4S binding protein [Pelosinus sp.]|nr:4Fe-4S binding protein [Pelosinus sp.]